MMLHRATWVRISVAVGLFGLLNLHCWQPGIGGRTDLVGGERPEGSEIELYYGWPACYLAKLLRSDDPELSSKMLRSAPFVVPPSAMKPVARYASFPAAVLDACFALFAVTLIAIGSECSRRNHWPRLAVAAAALIVLLLFLGYRFAPTVSTHL